MLLKLSRHHPHAGVDVILIEHGLVSRQDLIGRND
jgi:hypothetical protein